METELFIQCNPDIGEVFFGPKLEPVLPKQSRPNPDIRYILSGPDNSLISGLHCMYKNEFGIK